MFPLYAQFRNTRNHGIQHMFMGDPLSDGCDKTTVEPGNQFSPGIWSCGISVWVQTNEGIYCPDIMDVDKIEWNLDPQCMPVIFSRYRAGNVYVENRLTHLGMEGSGGVDYCAVKLSAEKPQNLQIYLVVKDIGPSGGKIHTLNWDKEQQCLTVNNSIVLLSETSPKSVELIEADDNYDSFMAVLMYEVSLGASKFAEILFRVAHGFKDTFFTEEIPRSKRYDAITVSQGFQLACDEWEKSFPAKLMCGDTRLVAAWENSIYHILSAMELGLPRIGAVNYPVFWIRDCVIVLHALDLIGRHDLAYLGNEYLAPLYFGGGFGAESDAPGEGIWSLVSHALVTGNDQWLETIFPTICKRISILENMLDADAPLRAMCENRKPDIVNTSGGSILCLAARDGLIHGRMDHHSPDFYINIWAMCGFRMGAKAATLLKREELARVWFDRAGWLEERIIQKLLPEYGNPRDMIVAPYPCPLTEKNVAALQKAFIHHYRQARLDSQGEAIKEKEWTYFEVAEIHNAMLLGFQTEAWIGLESFLDRIQENPVAAFIEGSPNGEERLPFRNDKEGRGWLNDSAIAGNMPHNWTTAETVSLIRDMFVVEKDNRLLLGLGVTSVWLERAIFFRVVDFPTTLGTVCFSAERRTDGRVYVNYTGPSCFELCMKADYFNGKEWKRHDERS